ncbi:hypothetical protein YC2023_118542 [Brassica napus]
MASHVVSAMAVTPSGPKRNLHCWSELPLDLMRLVFERLGFADFERAKSICPSWRSASRQSKPNNQIPWMFLIPKDKNYGLLFNPEEKDKVYKTQDAGNDLGKSSCVATYGSWLLLITYTEEVYLYNPYILNLLIGERINVPMMFDEENAVSIKKGDSSWKPITQLSLSSIEDCFNMIYKDRKLYFLNYYKLTIFDFSGHVPLQVFKISVRGCVKRAVGGAIRLPGTIPCKRYWACYKNNMVVTVDGDVLIVNSMREDGFIDGSKWEEVVSLGDEAILLELGITVLAKDMEGIKRNSIYFNGSDLVNPYDENDVFIFNLDTKKVEHPHQFLPILEIVHVRVYVVLLGVKHMCYRTFRSDTPKLQTPPFRVIEVNDIHQEFNHVWKASCYVLNIWNM